MQIARALIVSDADCTRLDRQCIEMCVSLVALACHVIAV
jgi:hypothetical protein